jgi:hypothetical protein
MFHPNMNQAIWIDKATRKNKTIVNTEFHRNNLLRNELEPFLEEAKWMPPPSEGEPPTPAVSFYHEKFRKLKKNFEKKKKESLTMATSRRSKSKSQLILPEESWSERMKRAKKASSIYTKSRKLADRQGGSAKTRKKRRRFFKIGKF